MKQKNNFRKYCYTTRSNYIFIWISFGTCSLRRCGFCDIHTYNYICTVKWFKPHKCLVLLFVVVAAVSTVLYHHGICCEYTTKIQNCNDLET